ncbi:MAG: heme o synthase [Anaerolineae bacterium]|nr:heme o synthase [Anaerolineae bacterium]MDK1117234.1 heme o synthase [Anaerolineae bacterium]
MNILKTKFKLYWPLIKGLQTGLLIATGVAGYLSAHSNPILLYPLIGSLFLSISGSTILNMWWDRDLDLKMKRTQNRPTSNGSVTPTESLRLGLLLSGLGVGWAVAVDALFGLVVFAGLFFDVIIYSVWLKRRTCWSIVWGGISGAMPVLAGRVLAVGEIEIVGLLLALAVLFWIPTHTLTFSIKFLDDYRAAGVPTFPSTYGIGTTRAIIAFSSIIAAASILVASILIGVQTGILGLIIVLSAGLLILSFTTIIRPSERVNFRLFRYASIYMLSSMILLSI